MAIAATCLLVTSACGSQIPPGKFFGGPNGGGNGPAASNVASNAPTSPGASGPGVVSGTAAGSTAPGGSTLSAGGPGQPIGAGHTSNPNVGPGGPGVTAGSCAGFTNSRGISNSAITLANSSDVTGPIPGLFASARQAVQAYFAYFNSTSSVCGRKLNLITLDSQTSDTGNQQAETTACTEAFALVGSMSAFDDGGAATGAKCGIPDLRAIAVNPARADSPVSYSADSLAISKVPTAPYDYIKSTQGDAYKHAALIYLNVGATTTNGKSFMKAEEAMGFHYVYSAALAVTEFNYAPYVASMQNAGVKYVQWVGNYQNAVNLKKAMDQQNFHPVFFMDSVAYDPGFAQQGGSDVNGTFSYVDTALFEEAARNPEMQLYLKWLHQVAPSAQPSFFGVFAWGAARLFAQEAVQLGGKLTRASLVAALKTVKNFTSNGLFAPQAVGTKTTATCQTVIQLEGGKWVRRSPYPYSCGSLVDSGIGK